MEEPSEDDCGVEGGSEERQILEGWWAGHTPRPRL